MQTPLGHEPVHVFPELVIMVAFQQVDHLMHHDVFKAFARLLREIGVQPDATSAGIAAPPLRLHLLHENWTSICLLANNRHPTHDAGF
jgi:hypothetical protein